MDYSIHRLNHESELYKYVEEWGWGKFKRYMERVYNRIDRMKPGEKFKIDDLVKEENRDVFIKILHLFIIMFGPAKFHFNNEYTYFHRAKEWGKEQPGRKLQERETPVLV